MSTLDVKSVKGNVTDDTKMLVMQTLHLFMIDGMTGFADSVGRRIKVTEISTRPKEWAPKKEEAVVVCEIEVTQGS